MSEENEATGPDPEQQRVELELSALAAEAAAEDPAQGEYIPGNEKPGQAGGDYPYDGEVKGLIEIILGLGGDMVAARAGDHWRFQPEETDQLSTVYAQLAHKYFPDLSLGLESTAVIVTAMVVGPKFIAHAAAAQAAAPEEVAEYGTTD